MYVYVLYGRWLIFIPLTRMYPLPRTLAYPKNIGHKKQEKKTPTHRALGYKPTRVWYFEDFQYTVTRRFGALQVFCGRIFNFVNENENRMNEII